MAKPNTGALGRIEGKVDVLTDLVVEQNKRIDTKVGWAPFNLIVGILAAFFVAITSFIGQYTFRNN